MNENKICPICHNDNIAEALECAYCGQRLKSWNLDSTKSNNYFKKPSVEIKPKKSWNNTIFIILIAAIIFMIIYSDKSTSVTSKVVPQKVINVNAVIALPNKLQQSIGNSTVENSIVEFNIKLSKSIKWVWFKISKGNELKDQVAAVANGTMNCRVYLPFGSGDYQVTILTSTLDNKNGTYYVLKDIKVKNKDARDMRFLMPDTDVQSDSEEIRSIAYKITESYNSDFEKTEAIHDWVSSNIAYDVEALINNKVHEYSAIETLEGEKAVCNGYANLTAALNRAIGIRCKIIVGTANNNNIFDTNSKDNGHAWNETYIDGKWIIQDTTWDAGGLDPLTKKFRFKLSHKYFNPSSSAFTIDHTKTSER